jgi:WD40 repeat protein
VVYEAALDGSGGLKRLAAHTKQITQLALNFDGSALLSGSDDATARLWSAPLPPPTQPPRRDVSSRQCLHVLKVPLLVRARPRSPTETPNTLRPRVLPARHSARRVTVPPQPRLA